MNPMQQLSPTQRRFPAKLYGTGTEPDPRFTLANERTYLAWIRTSLALLAGGVALEALGLDLNEHLRLAASVVLILTGIAVPALAWFGWMRVEKALRLSTPLPSTVLALPLSIALTLACALTLFSVVLV